MIVHEIKQHENVPKGSMTKKHSQRIPQPQSIFESRNKQDICLPCPNPKAGRLLSSNSKKVSQKKKLWGSLLRRPGTRCSTSRNPLKVSGNKMSRVVWLLDLRGFGLGLLHVYFVQSYKHISLHIIIPPIFINVWHALAHGCSEGLCLSVVLDLVHTNVWRIPSGSKINLLYCM